MAAVCSPYATTTTTLVHGHFCNNDSERNT